MKSLSLFSALIVTGLSTASVGSPTFDSVTALTSGDALEIGFVEHGLIPGQNYAYTGSSVAITETFQCYKSGPFTPLPRTFQVTAITSMPDVRGYTADENGDVTGFIFLGFVLKPFKGCNSPKQEAVPIFISYTDFELINIFNFDLIDVAGTFSGPIEPD